MVPGRIRWLAMLCSNSSAKLSVMCSLTKSLTQILRAQGVTLKNGDRSYESRNLNKFASDPQNAPDHLIDGHTRCIQHGGVGACDKRRSGARGIAPVTLRYLQRKGGKVSSNPLFFQLLMASAGPFRGARGEKNLDPCPGEYDGAHIAAVGHQTRRDGKAPLAVQECGADLPKGCDPGGVTARLLGTNGPGGILAVQPDHLIAGFAGAEPDVDSTRQLPQGRPIIQADRGPTPRQGDQPVQRTAIEQGPAQCLCDRPADGTLTRSGRAINGDDGDFVHSSP